MSGEIGVVALGVVISRWPSGGFGVVVSGGFGLALGFRSRGGFRCQSRSGGLGGGSGSCALGLTSEIIIDEFCRKSEHLYCESLFAPV